MHLAIFSPLLSSQYIVKGISYRKSPQIRISIIINLLRHTRGNYFTNFAFRMPVTEVRSGQTASFALKKIKRSQIRKGMVMVSAKLNPRACWQFYGDIMVLHHPTTIATRYQV
jgi:hypothetical protein